MTRQYVVGELSGLLSVLAPSPCAPLAPEVERLRREIEGDSRGRLPALVEQGLELADRACWRALELGDMPAFERSVRATVALREFAAGASLVL